MRDSTRKVLGLIQDAAPRLFTRVGKLLPETAIEIVPVRSWVEAVECCTSEGWHAVSIEAQNHISGGLPKFELHRWNDVVINLRGEIEPLMSVHEKKWVGIIPGFDDVIASTNWNLVCACIEVEFGIPSFGFSRKLLHWYLAGHFPCGWGKRASDGDLLMVEPVEVGG